MKISTRQGPSLGQLQADRSILIVDDEEVIRDLCAKALEDYRVLQAGDGEEALRLLDSHPIDLVLTDVMMPGVNGLELLQKIKHQWPTRPTIMMTGFGDRETILRSLKLGADDFINKPINLLQLRTVIARALEKKELLEELAALKKMDQLKNDFLGLVSHKLKTPVTVISLFIQNLARDIGDSCDADARRNLTLIEEESKYLASLIQDLLRYSDRVLPGRPQARRATDLGGLITSALAEIQEPARRRDLEIINTLPSSLPHPEVDPEQIRFCLEALLDNAVKFTPKGGRISLSTAQQSGWIEIRVSNTGPGIAGDLQGQVFDKFFQIDPDNTGQIRGFGLGLFYAREFALAHGGHLDLHSRPGQGACFTLRLPEAPERPLPQPT